MQKKDEQQQKKHQVDNVEQEQVNNNVQKDGFRYDYDDASDV